MTPNAPGQSICDERSKEHILDTALALGELYWVGLAGVMDGIAGRARETSTDRRTNSKE